MSTFTTAIPLTLYIHIPWCIQKCPYCDFNSHPQRGELPELAYIDRLIADLEFDLPKIWGRTIQTIFIGGGTPSIFQPDSIDKLITAIRTRLPVSPQAEITLEANPGTVEQDRFHGYREAGINRLSIGVQSFNAQQLKNLGRIHNDHEAEKAIQAAKNAGLTNYNLDIMFGLPNQTLSEALADLEKVIEFNPPHFSWYQLTLEPNTLFHHRPPKLPKDDLIWKMQEQGQALLKNLGYEQYEISAYCQQERKCRHNENYWLFGDYLGIGAGAHSKITDTNSQSVHRFSKTKHPKSYMDPKLTILSEHSTLAHSDLVVEFMLNALRLFQPIPFQLFEERTGLARSVLFPILEEAQTKGLIALTDVALQVTALGHRYLNDTLTLFL